MLPTTRSRALVLTLSLSSLLGLTAIPSTASADEPRGLGLEPISGDAARQAAVRIACTSPKARRYLRRTLRNVEGRRWGLVPTSLQSDTIDVVADAVYEGASQPDHRADALRRFVGDSTGPCEPAAAAAARAALDQADERLLETEVDKCTSKRLAERRRDPACALAAAVRSALEGDATAAQAHVADVVAAVTFDAIYTGKTLSEPQKDAMFEHIAYDLHEVLTPEVGDDTIDEDVLRAFSNLELDAVRSWRCKDRPLIRDLSEGVLDPQDAFCSATRPDLDTEKVPVSMTGPSGEKRTTNLTGFLHIAVAADHAADADVGGRPQVQDRDARVAEALLCALPLAPADKPYADCSAGALKSSKAGTFKLDVGGANWTVSVTGRADGPRVRVDSPDHLGLAALADGASSTLRLRASIGTLVRDKILGEDPSPEALRELATAALRVRRVARALDDAANATDRHAYILGPLEALPSLMPRFAPQGGAAAAAPATCDAPATPLDRMRCAASGSLRPLIVAAEDQRVRELATRVATLVGPRDRATCANTSGAHLLEAFAATIPDARASDALDPLGHEQLRTAAHELARCGVTEHDDAPVALSIVPSLGLRFSWNSAYHNAWGSDGFRIAPSLDVGSLRIRLSPESSRVRVGMHVSVIDLFAPLTELAMRRGNLSYDRQEVLWLELIRPRVDFTFGLPSVSKHLMLAGGVSLRTAFPYRGGGDVGAQKPSNVATYLAIGTPGSATAESFAAFVETNLGLKYVF